MKKGLYVIWLIVIGLVGCSKTADKPVEAVKTKPIKIKEVKIKEVEKQAKQDEKKLLLEESIEWAKSADVKNEAQKILSKDFRKYGINITVDSIMPDYIAYRDHYPEHEIDFISARVNFKDVDGWVRIWTQTEKKPFRLLPYYLKTNDDYPQFMFYDLLFEYYNRRINEKYDKIIPKNYISATINKLDPEIYASDPYTVFSSLDKDEIMVSDFQKYSIKDLKELDRICSSSAKNEQQFLRFMDKFMDKYGPVVFIWTLSRGEDRQKYLTSERVMEIKQKIVNKIMKDKRCPSGVYEFRRDNLDNGVFAGGKSEAEIIVRKGKVAKLSKYIPKEYRK